MYNNISYACKHLKPGRRARIGNHSIPGSCPKLGTSTLMLCTFDNNLPTILLSIFHVLHFLVVGRFRKGRLKVRIPWSSTRTKYKIILCIIVFHRKCSQYSAIIITYDYSNYNDPRTIITHYYYGINVLSNNSSEMIILLLLLFFLYSRRSSII